MIDVKLIPNVSEVFFGKNSSIIDRKGNFNFYALNNYANIILLHFEDNDTPNEVLFANFTPENNFGTYTSHWFYLDYEGISNRIVLEENKPRTFSTYSMIVPNIVLNNNNPNYAITNEMTIIRRSGFENLGVFDSLSVLNGEYPPTIELKDNNAFAYVVKLDEEGFYQVGRDIITNDLIWELREDIINYGYLTNQYQVGDIKVQKGYKSKLNLPTISDVVTQAIMNSINNIQKRLTILENDLDIQLEAIQSDTIDTNITKIGEAFFTIENKVKIDEEKNELLEKTQNGLFVKRDNTKQDKLIAGDNITIIDNVISATGGSSGGYEPDEITIVLNGNDKLEVNKNLEIDGGFL